MHEVLVNRLGGLSLPRKSVVRLTDRPDMTIDVYRGRKTATQQQQHVKWTDDFRFYVPFNNISVISGQWVDDNGRLCAMEPRSVNLTTLFLSRLRPPKRLTSTSCTNFRQSQTTALLESAEGETKVCGRTGYPTLDL